MNKSESKYYNTSLLMNQALIELLNKKDYEFLSVKEICKKAGVNRSTFYLHYDNIDDLLYETIENLNKNFSACFGEENKDFANQINSKQKKDLILITPKYLLPYLKHVKEHKMVYQVSFKHPTLMQSNEKYSYLQNKILFPIFDIFNIDKNARKYISAYYISGVYAIVDEWIKGGCKDDENMICELIIKCVRPYEDENEPKRENKQNKN